jgi:AcrR family transcriptional regulator
MVAPTVDNPHALDAMTPWGAAGELRGRQLRPGPSAAPDAVARNQRERLLGATVAAVAANGYETTRVADIVGLAGVSRGAFYGFFDNKLDCFLATLDELAELAEEGAIDSYVDTGGGLAERLEAVLERLVEAILAQPAAARVWLVEIYAAGPRAIARMDRLLDRLERLAAAAIGESPARAGMPREAVRAVLGGMRHAIATRLRHDRAGELPALVPHLVDWALGYSGPPQRLRRPRKPPPLPQPSPDPDEQRRRILATVTAIVAERGYRETTIADISARAEMSLTTFYDHFPAKREVFAAALDDGERQLVEVVAPVQARAPDWPRATRDATHAVLAYAAVHPAQATLGSLRAPAGGAVGLDRYELAVGRFAAMLRAGDGDAGAPDLGPVAAEAIGGTVAALLQRQIARRGAERAYEMAAIASYLALAPYVGAERACALANEGWQP